ncbi:hypothetical protein QTI51_25015 [Variovorax sp. J22G73]|uniref:hypothetical protein n=1 Tax=unclassified Variovorax TaxID=663243 RepID=UPI001051D572|nr:MULTISPECIES: hypothetical protein [unclassified Variovorax]MDM0007816.1 hypothetical protein [Variovorax sp. J22R203]MDM0100561.1 hypothetical protein [Variovorax sp. J22G73]
MTALSFGWKAGWLCFFGGFSLVLFMVTSVVYLGQQTSEILGLEGISEIFTIWVMGAVITGIFGTPCLAVIEKYFFRFSSRYMIGGAIAAWIAWISMAGPLFTPDRWHFEDLNNWVGSGLGYVGIYVGLGFTTGTFLTLFLRFFERRTNS